MTYLKFSLGIFLVLAASRFIPHPPNFTSLLALSFYVPAIFGTRYVPALILSFLITDLIIGFHNVMFFTMGSVLFIGLISQYFLNSYISRIIGCLLGAVLFYVITNFGVWSLGSYGYTYDGLIMCYTLALPFFAYSLISTLIFAVIIEFLIQIKVKFKNILIK
jgi:hypothetical protein